MFASRQHPQLVLTDWSHWLKVMNDQVLVMVRVNLPVWNVCASFLCPESFTYPEKEPLDLLRTCRFLCYFFFSNTGRFWASVNVLGKYVRCHAWKSYVGGQQVKGVFRDDWAHFVTEVVDVYILNSGKQVYAFEFEWVTAKFIWNMTFCLIKPVLFIKNKQRCSFLTIEFLTNK